MKNELRNQIDQTKVLITQTQQDNVNLKNEINNIKDNQISNRIKRAATTTGNGISSIASKWLEGAT